MSSSKEPTGATTLVVLLGANEWPNIDVFPRSDAFSNAVLKVKDYFTNKFRVPQENILDVFNSDKWGAGIDEEIAVFLNLRINEQEKSALPVRDIIIYYVGHGGFSSGDQEYYLAIRKTTTRNPAASSISIKSLALTLKESARYVRRTLILDCCFSAASYLYFQSAPDQAANLQTIDAFNEPTIGSGPFPQKGTALLCSSRHNKPSLIAPDGTITMFTDGLIHALEIGSKGFSPLLSLRSLAQITERFLKFKYQGNAPRPEVHSPDQTEGDIANIAFFPNFSMYSATSINVQQQVPPTIRPQFGGLPQNTHRTIGREEMIAKIKTLFQQNDKQILTITGCNGIGKTQLAKHIAGECVKELNIRFAIFPWSPFQRPSWCQWRLRLLWDFQKLDLLPTL